MTGATHIRRRSLLGGVVGSAALLAACDFSLRDVWKGLDAAKVWDTHCHVFGDGDSGSGLWFNPKLEQLSNPRGYVQREFYINASCIDERPGKIDNSFVQRLLAQCRGMAGGFKVLLFGFDLARDDAGVPMRERSTFHVPDAYVASLAAAQPAHFRWAASIHPYDPLALDRLDAAVAQGARAIKWLPSAQNIDPASPKCDRYYAKLAALNLPLITHAGDERAVHGFGEHLGNPLRLRRPLDAGVRVVVAHCASLGDGHIGDLKSGKKSNFELFGEMMDEPRWNKHLYGDIAAITQGNRMGVVATLLQRRDWHARLLNGSDYPLPGVVPLIYLQALAERQLLDPAILPALRKLREANVLLFDFVIKRSLALNGQRFAPAVFETAPFFARPG